MNSFSFGFYGGRTLGAMTIAASGGSFTDGLGYICGILMYCGFAVALGGLVFAGIQAMRGQHEHIKNALLGSAISAGAGVLCGGIYSAFGVDDAVIDVKFK